jgi:hypothetical protein
MTEIDAMQVIQKYADLLQESASEMVRQETMLPYPKAVIKQVLLHAMRISGRGDAQPLRLAYLELAKFQSMSEDEQRSVDAWNADNWGDDIESLANSLLSSSDGHEEVMARVQSEIEQLQAELAQFDAGV